MSRNACRSFVDSGVVFCWNYMGVSKGDKMNRTVVISGVKSAMLGLIVGDALGVPVEFQNRYELEKEPVEGMIGGGTYNKPKGTWSDDSSLMLATVDGLEGEFDPDRIMNNFVNWAYDAEYTADGDVFDIGNTTSDAITYYAKEKNFSDKEGNPANGSLMRILPIGLKYYDLSAENIKKLSFGISSLTHNHIECKLSCFYYCLLISFLMRGNHIKSAYLLTNEEFVKHLPKKQEKVFSRLTSGEIDKIKKNDILSTGYVIHSLESAIWCVLRHKTYKDAVLEAVNLGGDTDTIGAITGGIAGLVFGDIPKEWIEDIVNLEFIDKIVTKFIKKID